MGRAKKRPERCGAINIDAVGRYHACQEDGGHTGPHSHTYTHYWDGPAFMQESKRVKVGKQPIKGTGRVTSIRTRMEEVADRGNRAG